MPWLPAVPGAAPPLEDLTSSPRSTGRPSPRRSLSVVAPAAAPASPPAGPRVPPAPEPFPRRPPGQPGPSARFRGLQARGQDAPTTPSSSSEPASSPASALSRRGPRLVPLWQSTGHDRGPLLPAGAAWGARAFPWESGDHGRKHTEYDDESLQRDGEAVTSATVPRSVSFFLRPPLDEVQRPRAVSFAHPSRRLSLKENNAHSVI